MMRRVPGLTGSMGEQLGLWETQAETEATELLHHSNDNAKDYCGAGDQEQHQQVANFGCQAYCGRSH